MTFDFSSTTDDVLSGIDLTDKTVIVTGASGGLGEETARALTEHGANVTIAARNPDKLADAAGRIREATGKNVETGVVELDKPATVHSFAKTWLAGHDKLDILINNAGIMACPLTRTAEGWELQFATNHLGHFLLTNLLVPALKAGAPARVVAVASGGHYFGTVDFEDVNFEKREYEGFLAYGQSKTANIWFANELNRRLSAEGITAFSLHPGGIHTDLGRHVSEEALRAALESMELDGVKVKTIPQGAATSCWAATSSDLNGKGGLYFADCQIAKPGENIYKNHAPHAYDAEGASKLWDLSNKMLETEF